MVWLQGGLPYKLSWKCNNSPFFSNYSGIMLDSRNFLLFQRLCRHIRRMPSPSTPYNHCTCSPFCCSMSTQNTSNCDAISWSFPPWFGPWAHNIRRLVKVVKSISIIRCTYYGLLTMTPIQGSAATSFILTASWYFFWERMSFWEGFGSETGWLWYHPTTCKSLACMDFWIWTVGVYVYKVRWSFRQEYLYVGCFSFMTNVGSSSPTNINASSRIITT